MTGFIPPVGLYSKKKKMSLVFECLPKPLKIWEYIESKKSYLFYIPIYELERHEPVHAVKNENKSIINKFLTNFEPFFHAG